MSARLSRARARDASPPVRPVLPGAPAGRPGRGAREGARRAPGLALPRHAAGRRPAADTAPITPERRDELQRRLTICDAPLLHSSHRPPSTPPAPPKIPEEGRVGDGVEAGPIALGGQERQRTRLRSFSGARALAMIRWVTGLATIAAC